MSPLTGYECICGFIACVNHGLLTGVIRDHIAPRLLSAAQVALATIPKKRRNPGTRSSLKMAPPCHFASTPMKTISLQA